MEIQSAFNSGVQGFQKAQEDAYQAAASLAQSAGYNADEYAIGQQANASNIEQNTQSGDLSDINQEIVALKVAEYQAKASANVIETADEALGTLLDVTV
ncbi:hypothetical protein [Thalassotalea ganghwensis]